MLFRDDSTNLKHVSMYMVLPLVVSVRLFVRSINVAQYMRERNVAFAADGLRPHTRFYPFWDGQAGADVIPKLIEINMRSGAFVVGETVRGYNGNTQIFAARVAEQNHKTGPFNSPQRKYTQNPYSRGEIIPSAYSGSSTILNIDTLRTCRSK